MVDIMCPNCGEPVEFYYMMKQAIWDTPDGQAFGPVWDSERAEGRNPMLIPEVRQALEEAGWRFTSKECILSFDRCPCCKHHDGPPALDEDRSMARAEIVALLGDDVDGIASTLEDFGL